jgi:hypothetical protein
LERPGYVDGVARSPALGFAVVALASLILAGCGGTSGPHAVRLSLTAPVDGATVGVTRIEVLGTIDPKSAVVVVNGRPVRVIAGSFRQSIVLHNRLTRIRIVASAHGFVRSTAVVSVHYNPRVLPAASPAPAAATRPVPVAPAATNLPTPAESDFMAGCTGRGASAGGCACMYEQMVRSGFNSLARWEALLAGWRRSFLTQGVIRYPAPLRNAILACVGALRTP